MSEASPPLPGISSAAALVTPQAGKRDIPFFHQTSKNEVVDFFDPKRYQGKSIPQKPSGGACGEMITTKENIKQFFQRYNGASLPLQKRPAESEPSSSSVSSVRPMAKTKLSRDDLVAKFKLAAELNGYEWDDLAVSQMDLVVLLIFPIWFCNHECITLKICFPHMVLQS